MKEKEDYIQGSLEEFNAFAKDKWGGEDYAPSESLKAEMKANIMWRIGSIEDSESRIAYNSGFNKTNRIIDMEGEVYFEVSQNKSLPFIVKAEEIAVEALGTTFNIMAYGEKNEIITTLVEGRISASANGQELVLAAGERCDFNKNNRSLTQRKVKDIEHIIPWKNNELLFENESLSNVAATLERLYDVKVVFLHQSITQYTYTGLVRNNSLKNILELISNTSPVDYTMKDNIIEFSKR